MNINKDILRGEILPKLRIKDIINLRQVDRQYKDEITKEDINRYICNKITKRLAEIFDDKWPGFKKELERSGAVISGSFIIQSILDEYWAEDSKQDIDIYVSLPDDQINIEYVNNVTTKIESWFFENKFVYDQYEACDRYGNNVSSDIMWIRDFKFCEKEREIVYTNLVKETYTDNTFLYKQGIIIENNRKLIIKINQQYR